MPANYLRNVNFIDSATADFTSQWFAHSALAKNYQVTVRTGSALVVIEAVLDPAIHDPYTIWNGPAGAGTPFGPGTWMIEVSAGAFSRAVASNFAGGAIVSVSMASPLAS